MSISKNSGKKESTRKSSRSENASDGKGSSFLHKLFIGMCIVFAVVLLAGIVFLLWQIPNGLMFQNPRLRFYRMEVRSNGRYWQENKNKLREICGIREGDSVFAINVGDVRQQLLELNGIEEASVQLSLPDMLIVDLTERTPRAMIDEDTFIDEKGICFKREESSFAKQTFPYIAGDFKKADDMSGDRGVCNALELIAVANRDCRDVAIKKVTIANKNLLIVDLDVRSGANERALRVKFPTDREFPPLFNKLNNLLFENNFPEVAGELDLRYDDKASYTVE